MKEIIHLTKTEYKTFQIDREREIQKIKADFERKNYKFDWWGNLCFLAATYCVYLMLKLTNGNFTWYLGIFFGFLVLFSSFQMHLLYKNMRATFK